MKQVNIGLSSRVSIALLKDTMKAHIGLAGFILLGFILPSLISNQFYLQIILMIYLYAGLGAAWNILGGYAGQLSLGHAAYFGLGAYSYALLAPKLGILLGLASAAVVPVLFAAPIGWITFRLRGPYFSLGTIAFAELLRILSTAQLQDLTQGSAGLLVTSLTNQQNMYYYFMLCFFIAVFVITRFVVHSRTGYYLMAIREDEDTAQTVAINTTWYKLIALLISALITGVGGALFAGMFGIIEPGMVFGGSISNQIVFIVILGGAGTLWGPLVGAIILELTSELLKVYLGAQTIPFLSDPNVLAYFLYGLIIVLVILFLPEGVFGGFQRLLRRKSHETARAAKC